MNTLFLMLSIVFSLTFGSADKTITGVVIDESEVPLPGVSVTLKNSTVSAITDLDGRFSIAIPSDAKDAVLVFNYIGYQSQEITVGELVYVRVQLKPEAEELMEVVIVSDSVTKEESEAYDTDDESSSFGSSRSAGATSTGVSAFKRDSKTLSYSTAPTTSAGESRSMFKDRTDKGGASEKEKPKDSPTTETGSSDASDGAKAGLLTAGEVNDFMKWKLWKDIDSTNLQSYIDIWKMKPQNRYCVQVTNNNQQGLTDASVHLISTFGDTLWSAKTDNTGKAELWVNMTKYTEKALPEFELRVEHQGKSAFVHNPTEFKKGINFVTINTECGFQENVDIAFVVDATGSMGDEINYLKAEMSDMIERMEKKYSDINLRTASVFYRDITDSYLTLPSPFTDDAATTVNFIKAQSAGGGGDFPEAVEEGLDQAINKLEWRKDARSRILFLVLDAPPHQTDVHVQKMQELARKAAAKGIRIVPITGSGTDKSTEYLMRTLALATNGTYVFLTDDSGVGGGHIKPTTDKFDVESMNKLLNRLLDQYLYLPNCVTAENPENKTTEKREDDYTINDAFGPEITDAELSIFPNPTTGLVTIKGLKDVVEIFVTDMSGKILRRLETGGESKIETDLAEFPSGIYFIAHGEDKSRKAEKIIVRH